MEQGKETFERVTERHGGSLVPVKHFYRRQYQAAAGDWRAIRYRIFTDWKGIRRKIPLGSELKAARDALSILLTRNLKREDFDAEKQQVRELAQRLTLEQWGELYFSEMINPGLRSAAWQRGLFNRLKASSLGSAFLDEINEAAIDGYRDRRLRDPVTKFNAKEGEHKALLGRRIAYSSVNRAGHSPDPSQSRQTEEKNQNGSRVQSSVGKAARAIEGRQQRSDQQHLDELAGHWQRHVIGLLETAMRVSELLKLTWDKVDTRAGVIRLEAEDVKEKAPRVVPISPTLRAILDELKAERRRTKVTELSPRVFIHNGLAINTIRRPFELACQKAGVKDLHLHDLRHTAITRWSMAGVAGGAIMAASGHHSLEMHNRYVNLNENHLRDAFKLLPTCSQEISHPTENSINS